MSAPTKGDLPKPSELEGVLRGANVVLDPENQTPAEFFRNYRKVSWEMGNDAGLVAPELARIIPPELD